MAVAVEQVVHSPNGKPEPLGQGRDPIDQGAVALRAQERQAFGHRSGDVAFHVGRGDVYRVTGHDAVGRVLAARDADEAGHRSGDGMLA